MAAGNQGQPLIRQPVAVRGVRKQELEFALCLEPSACRCLASNSSPPLSFKEAFHSLTRLWLQSWQAPHSHTVGMMENWLQPFTDHAHLCSPLVCPRLVLVLHRGSIPPECHYASHTGSCDPTSRLPRERCHWTLL